MSIAMIGGGQPAVTQADLTPRTFTIRVNVDCKTEDKEGTAVVPIFEARLLRMKHMHHGGDATVTSMWLPDKMKYPRKVPLSTDNLRDIIGRLQSVYVIHQPNGSKRVLFSELFGPGMAGIRRFYDVIRDQAKAWRKLEQRIAGGHKATSEDFEAIAALADHMTPEIEPDIESDAMAPAATVPGLPDELDIVDPMADLQEFFAEKGVDTEVIMDVCKVIGDGETITGVMLQGLPSLAGKRSRAYEILKVWKAFQEHQARAEREAIPAPAQV